MIIVPDYLISAFALITIVTLAGAIGGFLAAGRGRNVLVWCTLSALLPPFLLFLYFIKPLCEIEGICRKCPQCGELIKWQASVCKYCQSRHSAEKC